MAEHEPAKYSVYLFYGDYLFGMAEAVESMRQKLGDPGTASLNFDRFSAERIAPAELGQVCASLPFLAERRLIAVQDVQRWTASGERLQALLQLLDQVPDTTALVLQEWVDLSRRRSLASYEASSPLLKWIRAQPERGYAQAFVQPMGPAFAEWLRQRCADRGSTLRPKAAHLLGEYVNDDPYLGVQELHKLMDYVDGKRPIEAEDVERLTPFYGQSDVFSMVDALGNRQGRQAMQRLHELLRHEDTRYAFAMIVRQFRLLIQAKDAQESGRAPETVLKTHPFVAKKASAQARNFSLDDLEIIYRRLLDIDVRAKSGRADLDVALDQLVVELTAEASPAGPR